MLLSLLIYAYSHGVKSSRTIERLCRRDAGYRYVVSAHVSDHAVIPRLPGRVASARRRAEPAQAAPGVCPAPGSSQPDAKKAATKGLKCPTNTRLTPPPARVTIEINQGHSLRDSLQGNPKNAPSPGVLPRLNVS